MLGLLGGPRRGRRGSSPAAVAAAGVEGGERELADCLLFRATAGEGRRVLWREVADFGLGRRLAETGDDLRRGFGSLFEDVV